MIYGVGFVAGVLSFYVIERECLSWFGGGGSFFFSGRVGFGFAFGGMPSFFTGNALLCSFLQRSATSFQSAILPERSRTQTPG
jgi:hypothetical protein